MCGHRQSQACCSLRICGAGKSQTVDKLLISDPSSSLLIIIIVRYSRLIFNINKWKRIRHLGCFQRTITFLSRSKILEFVLKCGFSYINWSYDAVGLAFQLSWWFFKFRMHVHTHTHSRIHCWAAWDILMREALRYVSPHSRIKEHKLRLQQNTARGCDSGRDVKRQSLTDGRNKKTWQRHTPLPTVSPTNAQVRKPQPTRQPEKPTCRSC